MGHGFVGYLLALAVGYWVLTSAAKEKGKNQLVGKIIAWVIIVVAAGGILCKASFCLMKCGPGEGRGYGCHMGGAKYGCHEMMKGPEGQPKE